MASEDYELENVSDTDTQVDELTSIIKDYEKLFSEQEKRIRELEEQLQQQKRTITPQEQEDLKEYWNKKFIEDPATTTSLFVQQAVQQAISQVIPQIQQSVKPALDNVQMQARETIRRVRKDYDEFEDAIEGILSTLPQHTITPEVVDAAYLVAKGYKEFGDYKQALVEGASYSSDYGYESDEDIELTDAQKRVARRFGISEEDYKERIKAYERRRAR